MSRRLALGVDFGTDSVRAMLVDCDRAETPAVGEARLLHGVMEDTLLASGKPLPSSYALQQPADYDAALVTAVRQAMQAAAAGPTDVIGIGMDTTACSMLPVDPDLTPLCERPELQAEPHAYLKLWKHHGATAEADAINRLAAERQEDWLDRYGGSTSSEWMLAKAWETLRRAPEVYRQADQFLEVGDWLVSRLTGSPVRGACAAGYKGMWLGDRHVGDAFAAALDTRLDGFFTHKLRGPILPAGRAAGRLQRAWAERLGLATGTTVSAPIIDAHAAVPGAGVTGPGKMVMILGTSTCHMLLSEREERVLGIQGVVRDGILPGFYGYEAGQAACGDLFDWLVDRLLGGGDAAGAMHQRLSAEAAAIPAGGTGLLVLDWWNGNRSVLVDPHLSGLIVGLTRGTRPAELYRALIEGTAFGTRRILDAFAERGLTVDEILACGGIAQRNPVLLQIYADVTGRPLRRVSAPEVCARGAAVFAAVAAGTACGGFETVAAAVAAMVPGGETIVQPSAGNTKMYDSLYQHWLRLHDHFGRGGHEVMAYLRSMRGD